MAFDKIGNEERNWWEVDTTDMPVADLENTTIHPTAKVHPMDEKSGIGQDVILDMNYYTRDCFNLRNTNECSLGSIIWRPFGMDVDPARYQTFPYADPVASKAFLFFTYGNHWPNPGHLTSDMPPDISRNPQKYFRDIYGLKPSISTSSHTKTVAQLLNPVARSVWEEWKRLEETMRGREEACKEAIQKLAMAAATPGEECILKWHLRRSWDEALDLDGDLRPEKAKPFDRLDIPEALAPDVAHFTDEYAGLGIAGTPIPHGLFMDDPQLLRDLQKSFIRARHDPDQTVRNVNFPGEDGRERKELTRRWCILGMFKELVFDYLPKCRQYPDMNHMSFQIQLSRLHVDQGRYLQNNIQLRFVRKPTAEFHKLLLPIDPPNPEEWKSGDRVTLEAEAFDKWTRQVAPLYLAPFLNLGRLGNADNLFHTMLDRSQHPPGAFLSHDFMASHLGRSLRILTGIAGNAPVFFSMEERNHYQGYVTVKERTNINTEALREFDADSPALFAGEAWIALKTQQLTYRFLRILCDKIVDGGEADNQPRGQRKPPCTKEKASPEARPIGGPEEPTGRLSRFSTGCRAAGSEAARQQVPWMEGLGHYRQQIQGALEKRRDHLVKLFEDPHYFHAQVDTDQEHHYSNRLDGFVKERGTPGPFEVFEDCVRDTIRRPIMDILLFEYILEGVGAAESRLDLFQATDARVKGEAHVYLRDACWDLQTRGMMACFFFLAQINHRGLIASSPPVRHSYTRNPRICNRRQAPLRPSQDFEGVTRLVTPQARRRKRRKNHLRRSIKGFQPLSNLPTEEARKDKVFMKMHKLLVDFLSLPDIQCVLGLGNLLKAIEGLLQAPESQGMVTDHVRGIFQRMFLCFSVVQEEHSRFPAPVAPSLLDALGYFRALALEGYTIKSWWHNVPNVWGERMDKLDQFPLENRISPSILPGLWMGQQQWKASMKSGTVSEFRARYVRDKQKELWVEVMDWLRREPPATTYPVKPMAPPGTSAYSPGVQKVFKKKMKAAKSRLAKGNMKGALCQLRIAYRTCPEMEPLEEILRILYERGHFEQYATQVVAFSDALTYLWPGKLKKRALIYDRLGQAYERQQQPNLVQAADAYFQSLQLRRDEAVAQRLRSALARAEAGDDGGVCVVSSRHVLETLQPGVRFLRAFFDTQESYTNLLRLLDDEAFRNTAAMTVTASGGQSISMNAAVGLVYEGPEYKEQQPVGSWVPKYLKTVHQYIKNLRPSSPAWGQAAPARDLLTRLGPEIFAEASKFMVNIVPAEGVIHTMVDGAQGSLLVRMLKTRTVPTLPFGLLSYIEDEETPEGRIGRCILQTRSDMIFNYDSSNVPPFIPPVGDPGRVHDSDLDAPGSSSSSSLNRQAAPAPRAPTSPAPRAPTSPAPAPAARPQPPSRAESPVRPQGETDAESVWYIYPLLRHLEEGDWQELCDRFDACWIKVEGYAEDNCRFPAVKTHPLPDTMKKDYNARANHAIAARNARAREEAEMAATKLDQEANRPTL